MRLTRLTRLQLSPSNAFQSIGLCEKRILVLDHRYLARPLLSVAHMQEAPVFLSVFETACTRCCAHVLYSLSISNHGGCYNGYERAVCHAPVQFHRQQPVWGFEIQV